MQPDFQEEWLTAFLDDELDDDQLEVVRQKLANDPSARQMLEDLKRVRQLVGTLPGWSGGDLQPHRTSVAALAPESVDRTEDSSYVTPSLQSSPPRNNSWRKWLGACAIAACILIAVGLAWQRYLSTGTRSTVAMQTSQPAALQGTNAATAESAQPMRDEDNLDATKTLSSLALPNSPTPASSAQTADAFESRNQPTEALLAESNRERFDAPRGPAPAGGMRSAAPLSAPTAPADPALANLSPSAPLGETTKSSDAESQRQEITHQQAMLPTRTRLGRSQAWQEQEASLALSQVARLIAPTASDADSPSPPADGKLPVSDRIGQVTEEKSRNETPASNGAQPYFSEKLDNQQPLPVALLQVEGGAADFERLFGEVVAKNQLIPIQLPAAQLSDLSLIASADAGVAAGNLADEPLLNKQLELNAQSAAGPTFRLPSVPPATNQPEAEDKSSPESQSGLARTPQETASKQQQKKSESRAGELPPPVAAGQVRPELAEGLNLRRADEQPETEKLSEERGQSGKSKIAPSQVAQTQATQPSATIILFVTRSEAQQIIDSLPTAGQETAQRSAGKATAQVNTAWWFIPAGIPANQPENASDKVILLLNPSP